MSQAKISFTRLTTSDKLSDRFLTCQSYNPPDFEQAQKGEIFSSVEILNPWFPTSQIGQTVINTLIKEYYRGQDTSELNNFEEAIKKVNEALAQIAQNGETDWIGKFSSVLVLINDLEAHFAQTGHSHAYLYRSGRVNYITESLEQEEAPHPLKTFSNLTSGTLQIGDRIIIANKSFFDVISPQDLKTIISDNHSAVAAIESAKILQMHGSQDANAIFIEVLDLEQLSNIPANEKIDTVYLDQQVSSLGFSMHGFNKKYLAPMGERLSQGLGNLFYSSKERLAPAIQKGFQASKEKSKVALQRSAELAKSGKERLSQRSKTRNSESEHEQIAGAAKPKMDLADTFKTNGLKAKNKLRRLLIQIGMYTSKKSKMYFATLIGVFLILAATITFSVVNHRHKLQDQTVQTKFDNLSTLEADASVAMTKKDEAVALSKYKQIVADATSLQGTRFADQANSKADAAGKKIEEIIKLAHLQPTVTNQLSTEAIDLVTNNHKSYALGKSGDVFEKKSDKSEFSQLLKVDANGFVSGTFITDTDLLAYNFSSRKISLVDIVAKSAKDQPVKTNSIDKIVSFNANLYQLDKAQNQIWKIPFADETFSQSTAFLKEKNDLSQTEDLAIDGSIYTLNSDGTVKRFSRGTKITEFKVALPADENLTYKRIFTDEGSDSLFLVSNDLGKTRIVEIAKNGSFITQYKLDSIDQAAAVAIDATARTVVASSGNKVLTYSLGS